MGFQVAFESENAFAQSNVSKYIGSFGWMQLQQKKRDGPVRCVSYILQHVVAPLFLLSTPKHLYEILTGHPLRGR